jgi:hypothetical protein
MEPLVLFGAVLVVYCGYLALLDSSKAWRTCRIKTAAKPPAAAKNRHAVLGRPRRPRSTTGIAVGRPLLQRG